MKTFYNLKYFKFILLLVFFINIISCNKEKTKNLKLESKQKIENAVPKDISIHEVLKFASLPTKSYEVNSEEDLSYGVVKRVQARLTIESGLKKSDIDDIIKSYILRAYDKKKPDGISVLVYEKGDNVNNAYTVALGEFTPTGDWGQISHGITLDKYKLKIKYRDAYFQPKSKVFKVGSSIKIYRNKTWSRAKKEFVPAKSVPISNNAREWVSENIIVNVPNNTRAKIIDIHREKLVDGSTFVRYKIKVTYKGKSYKGWIFEDEVKNIK